MSRPMVNTGGVGHALLCYPRHRKFGTVTPFPQQSKYLKLEAKYKLFLGGLGSGKTLTASIAFLSAALLSPDGIGLVIGRDYKQIKTVQWRTVMEVLDWWGKVNKMSFVKSKSPHEMKLTLLNGFDIYFRAADDPEKLRGPNVDLVFGDEVSSWTHQHDLFRIVTGRLRGSTRSRLIRGFFSTTPKGPFGIVGMFLEKCKKEVSPDVWISEHDDMHNAGFAMVRMKTKENTIFDSSYIETMKEVMDEEFFLQETEAKIIQVSGAVYGRHYHYEHNVRPFKLERHHEIHVCIDWGFSKPYVAFIAHDPRARHRGKGVIDVVFDEYVENNVGGPDNVIDYIERTRRKYKIQYIKFFYPDPAGRSENIQLKKKFPTIPQKVYYRTKDREILWGIHLVRSRLLNAKGERLFFVSKKLTQEKQNTSPNGRGCVKGFLNLQWRERRGQDWSLDKIHDDEHVINGMDAIRYYIVHQYATGGGGPVVI